jgi:hypothetical protein
MFEDGALVNAVLDSDACEWGGEHLNQIPDVTWKAVRTDVQISDRDKLKPAIVKVGLETNPNAPAGQQDAIYLLDAGWQDDGDNVPEDDEIGCFGGTRATVTMK